MNIGENDHTSNVCVPRSGVVIVPHIMQQELRKYLVSYYYSWSISELSPFILSHLYTNGQSIMEKLISVAILLLWCPGSKLKIAVVNVDSRHLNECRRGRLSELRPIDKFQAEASLYSAKWNSMFYERKMLKLSRIPRRKLELLLLHGTELSGNILGEVFYV